MPYTAIASPADDKAYRDSSFSKKAYCLFLGNSVYLSAPAVPQHHEQVWISVQN